MPEIGEVARIVHYLKKHVVGRVIRSVKVEKDDLVFNTKVGTDAAAFQKAMTGKKVLDAGQQGKYFWLVMDRPPHPLMHFGMTGWIELSNERTAYYKPKKEKDKMWPPKYWKFRLEMEGEPECEVAFFDGRRLGRIRLVDVAGDQMRNTTPLKENGPDPVIDKDVLTVDWLAKKLRSKKVPVKALLLDQANISGVGNWVGDEVLYQARLHPEQYSNTFSDEQIQQLHDSLLSVCTTAVENLAESDKFPENWLMKYRWDKRKKDSDKLPNGEKIVHLMVGGRTSAIVPSVQKKTGAVSSDISAEATGAAGSDGEKPKAKASKRKAKVESNGVADGPPAKKSRAKKNVDADEDAERAQDGAQEDTREAKPSSESTQPAKAPKKAKEEPEEAAATPGRRRSARVSGNS